jgi:hypothetical protein
MALPLPASDDGSVGLMRHVEVHSHAAYTERGGKLFQPDGHFFGKLARVAVARHAGGAFWDYTEEEALLSRF